MSEIKNAMTCTYLLLNMMVDSLLIQLLLLLLFLRPDQNLLQLVDFRMNLIVI